MRVFVIDDDEIINRPLIDDLKEAGHDVKGFLNPITAFIASYFWAVDVIITDVQMMPIDGLKLASRIKNFNKSVNILVMSSNKSKELKYKIEMSGYQYMSKPVELPNVLDMLDSIQKGNQIKRGLEKNYYREGNIDER